MESDISHSSGSENLSFLLVDRRLHIIFDPGIYQNHHLQVVNRETGCFHQLRRVVRYCSHSTGSLDQLECTSNKLREMAVLLGDSHDEEKSAK